MEVKEGKYRILIKYTTGDSFGSNEAKDYLELTWNNLDVAKENLKRIEEHYDMYEAIQNIRWNTKKTVQQILTENKHKHWFVEEQHPYSISNNMRIKESTKNKYPNDIEYRIDTYTAKLCIFLKADNGNKMRMSSFWCGFFEKLLSAEIETNESDMKFERF